MYTNFKTTSISIQIPESLSKNMIQSHCFTSITYYTWCFVTGISSSIVCMSNWFFAFLVTKFFITLVSAIFIYNTFFLFSFFSLLGIFFVILIVPETKSKTMEEIQVLLGADPVLPVNIENQNETQG